LRTDRQWVEIEPGRLTTDLQIFDEAVTAAQIALDPGAKASRLSEAVGLLNGPFLAGFQEPWVLAIRRDYEEKARRAWLSLADALQALGQTDEALRATMDAVRHAPLDIDANASLIRRYVESGRAAQARQAFREFDAMMFRELGRHAPPSVRSVIDERPADAERLDAGETIPKAAIPRPLPLHGRSELLESIQAALSRPGANVVLVGAVGVGKTHLLKEAAWLFARTNDLPVQIGGVPAPVFDGLFVPDPKPYRAELLESVQAAVTAGWRVLAESRFRLQSEGITEIVVNPLPVPDPIDEPVAIRANPSVQILVSKVSDGWEATPGDEDLRALAQLALRLDGLPSALKVISTRLMIQAPDQVLKTLDDGLAEYAQDLLPGGETVGLAVLLMAAGLSDHARDQFVGLALLDGASVDLATKLAEPFDAAETWRSLENQCLITVHEEGPRKRYRVPRPIAFAIRNMADPGDRAAIEAGTWRVVADWAFEKSRLMVGPQQEYAFNAVQAELSNLIRGLEWSIEADHELAGELLVSVWRTICARGNPSSEAPLLLRAARVGTPLLNDKLAGEAWLGTATAFVLADRIDIADSAYHEARKVFEASGDTDRQAWVDINYAEGVVARSDVRKAIEMSKAAADLTTYQDVRAIGLCYYAMGLADMGETAEAVRVGEEVFASRLQTSDLTEQARAYGDLAKLYRKVGRPEAAEPLLEEGVRRLRETGIQDMLLETLLSLAELRLDSKDIRDVVVEASALANRIGSNAKLLEVARVRMAWASRRREEAAFIAAVEDTFRFTQISQSAIERKRSLLALADELERNGKPEYANAVRAALREPSVEPVHAGWRALLSSESHGTVCVLAVVMAKEAVGRMAGSG
jgi:tetratricopeptide (TPR) repeat protein